MIQAAIGTISIIGFLLVLGIATTGLMLIDKKMDIGREH